MTKKYELIKATAIHFQGKNLYRIKALRSFGEIPTGQIGGYIESEDNLSHEGNAWVGGHAHVLGHAKIYENAQALHYAIITDDAEIFGNAEVTGRALIGGQAKIFDQATIRGSAFLYDQVQVFGNAEISENITLNQRAKVYGNAEVYDDIRIEHAKQISEFDCDGYAIGGLAVGESHEQMYHVIEKTVPYLPQDKPTYLMGVGTPTNILEAVERGVDFFDCVYPTRNGRHGHLYTNHGKINLFNAQYELDERPIEEGCQCPACRRYSRAYIRHLLKAKEMLGMRLCVLHNLYFYNTMMEEIRDALDQGSFSSYKKQKLEGMQNS